MPPHLSVMPQGQKFLSAPDEYISAPFPPKNGINLGEKPGHAYDCYILKFIYDSILFKCEKK